ncbi:helicase-associated domain-containing protein [Leekyejoonella antrihumi]|uniref:Helicase XPB/Ssl2 N-terminal domain-containing protein n=1 Tax=Leekyejoonella antrihumi TaxID=1660198 RepID=A0A563E429_9MICO|nr:helicase-associated domain-containing protein [Leekyejoonella antrihumi]TWP37280.1 hypothetical protein FGL98_05840 [Leekyejoonella antrihumi]
MPSTARSYAEDLRTRSDDELRVLLQRRPDLARPAPSDLTALAARASTRASVQRALGGLEADQLHALEAVLVSGDENDPARLLGCTTAEIDPLLQDLWAAGLLWRSPEGLRTARAVGELLTRPAKLGPPTADLPAATRAVDADAAYNHLSSGARKAIDQLRWTHPSAAFTGATGRTVLTELTDAGLMVRTDLETGTIPREVGLALRGGQLYPDALRPPPPEGKVLTSADVDAAAGAEALELLWRLEELATAWETDPPRVLRSGGLSVRDHRIATARLEASPELSAFIIELAYAAGLLSEDGQLEPCWLPTSEYDNWAASTPIERWARLVDAWWETIRAPFLVGTGGEHPPSRTGSAPTINVLGPGAAWPLIRHRRQDVLRTVATLPEGTVAETHSVDVLLRWHRPLRLPPGVPTRADVVLREAGWLGLTGRGALSSAGRAVVDGHDVSAAMSAHFPEPVDHVLIQADLTAIAPGPLEDSLRRVMHVAADVESRGGATVFRFTKASVRRALDTGMTSDELLRTLQGASSTPLPQPLTYLISDLARRHGQARVGTASSYVRSDDETALTAMLADRDLSPLQLRRIAPSVLVSPASPGTVLDLLREHQHSPIAETSDGGVVITGRTPPRAHSRHARAHPVQVTVLDEPAARAMVSELRQAETARAQQPPKAGPRIPATDPTVTLGMLQDATAEQVPVWIGYVDASGSVRRTLFTPHRVEGGRAVGVTDDDRTQTFSIHRITGVAPA